MKRSVDEVGFATAGGFANGSEETQEEQGGAAGAGVRGRTQEGAPLSARMQVAEGGAKAELTTAPVLGAAASSSSAAATDGAVVRDLAWYREQAERGDASAQIPLAQRYHRGEGVKKDADQAFDWMSKAAQQGYANAQGALGRMYGKGVGVAKDLHKACDWTSKAAQQGQRDAQRRLSSLYRKGEGVKQDLEKAVEWLLRSGGWASRA